MAVKLKPNVPLQYDKSMQFIYLTFLTFALITLEPIIVEIGYGYHWNCIKKNPLIFEKKLEVKICLTSGFKTKNFFIATLYIF